MISSGWNRDSSRRFLTGLRVCIMHLHTSGKGVKYTVASVCLYDAETDGEMIHY